MLSVGIRGIEATVKSLEKITVEKRDKVRTTLAKAMFSIERDAKINCPWEFGVLKGSIRTEVFDEFRKFTGRVSANTDYAAAVETMRERHPGATPRKGGTIPYLYPAFEKQIGKIAAAFQLALK